MPQVHTRTPITPALSILKVREYAARYGIDPRTFSKYLNGGGRMNPVTIERCRAAAKAAGVKVAEAKLER